MEEGIAQGPMLDHVRLALGCGEEPDVHVVVGCEVKEEDEEEERSAYMFGPVLCCMLGRSLSDCAPSVAPFMRGIGGGVGTFLGRS